MNRDHSMWTSIVSFESPSGMMIWANEHSHNLLTWEGLCISVLQMYVITPCVVVLWAYWKQKKSADYFTTWYPGHEIPLYKLDCKKKWSCEWRQWSDADIMSYQVILCPSVHHWIPRFLHRFKSIGLSWTCILIIRLINWASKGLMDQFKTGIKVDWVLIMQSTHSVTVSYGSLGRVLANHWSFPRLQEFGRRLCTPLPPIGDIEPVGLQL